MARIAIKALVVTALVCLVFDCSRGAETLQQPMLDNLQEAAKGKLNDFMNSFKQSASETQPGLGNLQEVAKGKVNEFMNSLKQKASDTYNKMQGAVQEPENTKKVDSQLNSFFSSAFSRLKSTFSSTKTNPDDLSKQEAIKAFDDYAVKHPK